MAGHAKMRHPPKPVVDHAIALLGYQHGAVFIDTEQRGFRISRSREALAGAVDAITNLSQNEASKMLGVGHTTYLQWLRRFGEWPPVLRAFWIERVRLEIEHGNIEETRSWWKDRT